jgi:hypothetical protein
MLLVSLIKKLEWLLRSRQGPGNSRMFREIVLRTRRLALFVMGTLSSVL